MSNPPSIGRAPSLTDVAALAGVSHQTVSRVVNNHPNVAESTRTKVQQAVDKLNYRRNMSARLLATGRSSVFGVITPNTTLYGPSTTVGALSTAAGAADLTLSVEHIQGFTEAAVRGAVDRLLSHGVDGLLVIVPVTEAADVVTRMVPAGLPVVTIDGPPDERAWTVSVDQHLGAVLATRHLLDLGHPTVWHLAGPSQWNDARAREAGWRAALSEAGIEPPPVLRGDWSPGSGYHSGQLLARMPECTAVFVANDHMALGVTRACAELGRTTPRDLSIVGFDDVPESAYFSPPLTTVHQDFAAVGRVVLELLLGRRDGRESPAQSVLIPPRLVLRQSTAQPSS